MSTQRDPKTPAQWYCLLAGLALLFAGLFGWIADASLGSGSDVEGDLFLGFEVNGWHNIVHLLSGLVLFFAGKRRTTAKAVAIAFGLVYGAVALWGLLDEPVLGLIPINDADTILHIALAALGVLAGVASDARDPRRETVQHVQNPTGRRIESHPIIRDALASGDAAPLDPGTGRPRERAR